jgi:hypothetical protein
VRGRLTVLVLAAWLAALAAMCVRPCRASDALAPDSALRAVAARTNPTADELARLRARTKHARVRVWLRDEAFVVDRVRIEPAGLAFEAADARGEERRVGRAYERPLRPPSPIAWDDVTAVEVRHSRMLLGTLIGIAAGLIVLAQPVEEGAAGDVIQVGAAAGMVAIGAGAGALASHWDLAWSRPPQ